MNSSAMPVSSGADAQQEDQGEDRGQDAADELDQAGADEVAHAFDVAHDARDQHAGLVRVVVGHGQTSDVLLHLAAQFGDQALRLLGEQLGQGERGRRPAEWWRRARPRTSRGSRPTLCCADDVVHQVRWRRGAPARRRD